MFEGEMSRGVQAFSGTLGLLSFAQLIRNIRSDGFMAEGDPSDLVFPTGDGAVIGQTTMTTTTRHNIRPTAADCGASARPHRPRHRRHDPRHHRHRHRHRYPQRRQHHDLLREPPARTADARTRRGWGTQATARTARTLRATARPRRGSTSTIPRMATWRSSTATATAARARACYRSQGSGGERVARPREHEPLLFCVGPSPACCRFASDNCSQAHHQCRLGTTAS